MNRSTVARGGRSSTTSDRGNLFRSSEQRLNRAATSLRSHAAHAGGAPATPAAPTAEQKTGERYNDNAIIVELKDIRLVPEWTRETFPEDKMEELKASIKEQGLLEPLGIRTSAHSDYKYDLIFGYRRFKALTELGKTDAPAVLHEMDNVQASAASLSENLQRQDPDATSQAKAFASLRNEMQTRLDKFLTSAAGGTYGALGEQKKIVKIKPGHMEWMQKEWPDTPEWMWKIIDAYTNLPQAPKVRVEDMAALVGMATRTLYAKVAIANLPEDVRDKITIGEISETQASEIVKVRGTDDEDTTKRRRAVARIVVTRKRRGDPISDAELKEQVRRLSVARSKYARPRDNDLPAETVEDSDGSDDAGSNKPQITSIDITPSGKDASLAVGAALNIVRTAVRSAKPHFESALGVLEATKPNVRQPYYKTEIAPYVQKVRSELRALTALLEQLESTVAE